MKKKKVRNPLIKRIPKELLGDWKKYLVVFLFLVLTIGFVSGMYVANESMMTAASEGKARYHREDGHFELDKKADDVLITAIETGDKADVKQYYLDKAKDELDDKFAHEFDDKFKSEFDQKFKAEFDSQFEAQVKQNILAMGLDEASAEAMVSTAVESAKQDGSYQSAYDSAYEKAYDSAYDEAYDKAYEEAWDKVQDEINDKYDDAKEKYELDDKDFNAHPVTVYENFFRNEDEDYNNDGTLDGTIRVFPQTDYINQACILDGRLPENENEIAIDRMHADNVGVKVGDTIAVSGNEYEVVGLIAYVNYSTLHEKTTDLMFDALKFDVAMVTEDGFDRLSKPIHYSYAWQYTDEPADETEEKTMSDDFMKALLTQTVVADNELSDYVPSYSNPAINFATDDMGSDEAMGGVLLDILIVIIAFIFGVTISNTIAKESSAIGTLRASGYTKGELIRHYISMPVLVTILAAIVGNALGYSFFKGVVVGMYYNSYSLPAYVTIWNPDAFVKTTLVPVILMLVVNLIVIVTMMQHTPLQFLRHDLKKSKKKKAMRLPSWKFISRFRLRIMFQNMSNYLILFIGILFVMVMLAMAVGMPDTLDFYKKNTESMMFADYQYVLKSYEDEDGNAVTTDVKGAEKFDMTSLVENTDNFSEEISVYGIAGGSSYVDIADLKDLKGDEAYISATFADKYGISVGDEISLDARYENKSYSFKVAGLYDKCQSLAVFMPIDSFSQTFELKENQFSGFLSNEKLDDIDEDNVAAIITIEDITKMANQLDHSMGSYMTYFQVLCILLSAVLIYLLTKLIIEKNENAISMTKILGYENREIASLYLLSTTIVVIVSDIISVVLGTQIMNYVWRAMLKTYSGWFNFRMKPTGYVKMFGFVFIGYLIVMLLDFRRIKKIPMDQALKNVE